MCLGPIYNQHRTKQKIFYKRLLITKGKFVTPVAKTKLDIYPNKATTITLWSSIKGWAVMTSNDPAFGKMYVWNEPCVPIYNLYYNYPEDIIWLVESLDGYNLTDGKQTLVERFKVLGQVIDEPHYKKKKTYKKR